MKHIVLFTTSYPRGVAGSEAAGAFVRDLVAALRQHCRVTLVAPGKRASVEIHGDLTIYRYWSPAEPLSTVRLSNPLAWLSLLRVLSSGTRVARKLSAKARSIDHILALWALPCGWWARALSERIGARYSVWALGSDIWGLGRIPLVKRLLASVLRRSHAVYADGFLLCDDVTRICGRPCRFLASTRNIGAVKGLKASAPPYTLGFLGRWHRNKGVDLLLDALALLADNEWARIEQVTIAGGGALEHVVREKVSRLQAGGRPIALRGYLDQAEAAAFFERIDFLLLPSRIESIPVIFSDAVKYACPVVATPVGDLPLLIGKYGCGELAGAVDARSFATAIKAILHGDAGAYMHARDSLMQQFDLTETARRIAGLADR